VAAEPDGWGALRLTTIGRRTGRPRQVVVGYFEDGRNLITMAMNGWGAAEPAWWLNLQAHPDATAQTRDGARRIRARRAQGDERERLWSRWAEIDKNLDTYRAAASGDRRGRPRATGHCRPGSRTRASRARHGFARGRRAMRSRDVRATTAGLLFIAATATSLIATAFLGSLLKGPGFLATVTLHQDRLLTAALFQLIAAFTSAAIAVALYPVLREHAAGMALGAVAFRLIEGVFYALSAAGTMILVSLSGQLTAGASAHASADLVRDLRFLQPALHCHPRWNQPEWATLPMNARRRSAGTWRRPKSGPHERQIREHPEPRSKRRGRSVCCTRTVALLV
jgi:deazaflavin-dependent oxidoreductase (nitroreductase family)